MSDFIPVNTPLLDGNERKYLEECIATGWISSEGPFVEKFELEVARFTHRKHAVAVSNGTAALDLAIDALRISVGDEVIIPSFTIISCVHQIIRVGAVPVVVDSDLSTWNMDVSKIEENITARTKAIMAVHIYGLPVDMSPLMEIAHRHSLFVIEDAAEMIGQTYYGKKCGGFGDISTFSFYPNKHITTGEGGMVLTDDDELADRLRSARNLCFESSKRFVHDRLGWNYRMTNLQAAIGVAQLERLTEFVKKKRHIGARYESMLGGIKYLNIPLSKTDYANNIYWVFGLLISEKCKMNASEAMVALADMGVGTRPFFYPMHKQPVLLKLGLFEGCECPNSELMYERGFYIPSGLALTDAQIDRVGEAVRYLFEG